MTDRKRDENDRKSVVARHPFSSVEAPKFIPPRHRQGTVTRESCVLFHTHARSLDMSDISAHEIGVNVFINCRFRLRYYRTSTDDK